MHVILSRTDAVELDLRNNEDYVKAMLYLGFEPEQIKASLTAPGHTRYRAEVMARALALGIDFESINIDVFDDSVKHSVERIDIMALLTGGPDAL